MHTSAPFARLGTASWIRVTAVAVAMLAVCLLVVSRSTSAFSGTTSNTGNSLSTGSVTLTDNDGGTALFDVSNMNGGQTVSRCIEVTYTGTSTVSAVRLYGSSSASALTPYLELVVERGSTGATCPSPGGLQAIFNGTTPVPSDGNLEAFITSHTTYANAIDTGWTPTTGDTKRAFLITFTVKNDDAAQNKIATPAFTWEVRNA